MYYLQSYSEKKEQTPTKEKGKKEKWTIPISEKLREITEKSIVITK